MNPVYSPVAIFGILVHLCTIAVAHEAIIGGILTSINRFRYLVSLLEVDHGHLCGGAIIGEYFVLSAAHCFVYSDNNFKSKRVFALMGTRDLMKMALPAFNSEVIKVYIPKDYDAASINSTSNIAVLRLKESMQLGYYKDLKAAKLERNRTRDYSGKKGIIAGWGWNTVRLHGNEVDGGRTDSLLRFASADVLSHQQCQQEHRDLKITESHLCAKVEQVQHHESGVCFGDDGGPLVYDGTVIGVLSLLPHTCAERTRSAIYTRVSHHLIFIRNAKGDYVSKNMRAHVLQF